MSPTTLQESLFQSIGDEAKACLYGAAEDSPRLLAEHEILLGGGPVAGVVVQFLGSWRSTLIALTYFARAAVLGDPARTLRERPST